MGIVPQLLPGEATPWRVPDRSRHEYLHETLVSKSLVRTLAREIGEFAQPSWICIHPDTSPDREREFLVYHTHELIESLPFEGISAVLSSGSVHSVVVETSRGSITLTTGTAPQSPSDEVVPPSALGPERLREFFRDIVRQRSAIGCFEWSRATRTELSVSEGARAVLDLGPQVYIKPNRDSARGTMVIRYERGCRDGGIFRTDCGVAEETLRRIIRNAPPLSPDTLASIPPKTPKGYHLIVRSDEEARAVLEGLFSGTQAMHRGSWIVEEAIPIFRSGGMTREFRIVLERDHLEEPFRLVGHYAKCSRRSVAGNIAAGGFHQRTHDALVTLVKAAVPQLGSKERDERAQEIFHTLIDATERYSEGFLRALHHLTPLDTFARCGFPLSPLTEFDGGIGVDLVPTWNGSKFRWFMMETQSMYVVDGLEKIEGGMAARMKQNRCDGAILRRSHLG